MVENRIKSFSYQVPVPSIKENNINIENMKNTSAQTNEMEKKVRG